MSQASGRSALPLSTMISDVLGYPLPVLGFADNSTALQDPLQGRGKQVRHLRRHHRVCISLINEIFDSEGYLLGKVDSFLNTVDIFTNVLGVEAFSRHVPRLG